MVRKFFIQLFEFIYSYLYPNKTLVILTREHCFFIANLIQNEFTSTNYKVKIINKKPKFGFTKNKHIVICPQIFNKLPKNYIAYQMEQAVSTSPWFNESYLQKLNAADYIFDYSLANIDNLKTKLSSAQKHIYMPIYYVKDYFSNIKEEEFYDVGFYGECDIERRIVFINAIKEKYKVNLIYNCYKENLIHELKKCKIIINIHYYENAILETTRIYESLSLNKLLISESSVDIENHKNLNDIVDFIPIGDVEAMLNKISYWIDNQKERETKIANNVLKLSSDENLFSKNYQKFNSQSKYF